MVPICALTNFPSNRCDVLSDSEPPLCQHCKQYGFECTFFLPIAETRFKKKKLEEEAAEKARSENAEGRHPSTPLGESSRPADARVYGAGLSVHDCFASLDPPTTAGPTSEEHLLHSSATIPSRLYENYDARHHHTWEVSQTGDGLIQVIEPNVGDTATVLQKPVDMRIERDMVEKLANAYFTEIAPVLPIITQTEFLSKPSPPPILLYSICLVAAARRDVPQSVFDAIRYAVNTVIKVEDVLSTASIANVQSLLILSMVGDCHSQFVPNALSALWIRLGTAIRMVRENELISPLSERVCLCRMAGSRSRSSPRGGSKAEHRNASQAMGYMSYQRPMVTLLEISRGLILRHGVRAFLLTIFTIG